MFVLLPDVAEREARRAASWISSRGLHAGDRLGVIAGNHPGYVPLTLGALRSGVVPVPINVHLSSDERDRIVTDADCALVVDESSWPDLSSGAEEELAPHPLARPMHYTSGTTGLAKGVWSGLLSVDDAAELAADEQELWDPHAGDTYLMCSPFYHSAPHRITISALGAGARVLVFEQFDAADITKAFRDENVNGAFLVPTHLRRLLNEGFKAPAARRILHAGEACPEPLKWRAIDAFGADNLWEFYGSTEGQFTWCSSKEWLERPGTIGRARTGRRLSIDDPDENGVGTIWIEAPSFARWDYWRDPEKTESSWRGLSFTVGDLGRLDTDGYLYLEGRREDLIIYGGVNVYPAEVERVLSEHPDVVEAAVFGVRDDDWGQRVCAAITGSAEPDAVRAFAKERLPGSHVPKQVFVVDELPRTQTGKVRRSELASRTD